ncbi:AAA family ATPase [Klebsiella michiganensis]|uniref:AAA family ATPase n=1 Tax=Phytobacter palmae TaxID=1855371 RepID=A0ABU9VAM8_9ENTR|nr:MULTISPECIES: AAA family ATPase [Enterobacteriaceae]EBT5341703.1 ATPase [Salmonella enterica]EDV3997171.1 AAA domain-containing protein [Salmonella enterica subsp. enterica serovar Mbandaka]EDW6137426.1 AAA domain-containing protein [Salmonella enterica subsp. enterica]MBJ5345768.1 AAA family ATPase [Salmonella enterica subsp. enterica serovar Derby]MDU7016579.1 AAA family ATPase [Enterobacter sp.]HBC9219584.1 AAA family ATPase [Enterobacter cloacae]HBS5813106.1 AAA family ATPase [Klebsie
MVSKNCKQVLKLLARSRNVLVSGAPGTGKSKLLAEVALAFETAFGLAPAGGPPQLNPMGGIPIPPAAGVVKDIPAPTKMDRKVFRTVFHQNSKYRDFLSGITPAVNKTAGDPDFTIVKGTLYRASEHAKGANGAALLIIDEINRGPAVQVFGGAIVAIESDKRLASDGAKLAETQFFEMLDPVSGDVIEYALPHDLYILAAMNQADASVEPLDVAFLRRWEPMRLEPDEAALRTFYGLGAKGVNALPDVPASVNDALEASVSAWIAVNAQIALGRGPEFQIGHGVLMSDVKPQTLGLNEALGTLCVGWAKVRAHVEEVFFGDTRGIAAALNALDGPAFNPFKLTETTFADDLRFRFEGPTNFAENNIYAALRAFANPRG